MKEWFLITFIILMDICILGSFIAMLCTGVNVLLSLLVLIITGTIMFPFNYYLYLTWKDKWGQKF